MTIDPSRHSQGIKFAAALALVTILGPVATDMYLPSMPDIAHQFKTTYANVQLTLTVFLAAQGAGQLLFGPVVDRFGRRRPLLIGIGVFIAASLWAASSGSVNELMISRFIQGLASSLTLVVVMSMVRDVSEGVRAARLFAMLVTIEGVAPILAPTAGGFVDAHFGWRAVMIVLMGMGMVAMVNSMIQLSETLPRKKRLSMHPRRIAANYIRIATDSRFMLPALSLSMVFFFMFAYVSGASFVYQNYYGLSSGTFGLVLGATGIATLLGAVVNARFVAAYGVRRFAMIGALCVLSGASIALASETSSLGLNGIVAGMSVSMFGLGIAEASLMSMAMSSQRRALGYTAALMGALHLILGSAATPIAGELAVEGSHPWLLFLALSGGIVVLLTAVTVRRAREDVRSLGAH